MARFTPQPCPSNKNLREARRFPHNGKRRRLRCSYTQAKRGVCILGVVVRWVESCGANLRATRRTNHHTNHTRNAILSNPTDCYKGGGLRGNVVPPKRRSRNSNTLKFNVLINQPPPLRYEGGEMGGLTNILLDNISAE